MRRIFAVLLIPVFLTIGSQLAAQDEQARIVVDRPENLDLNSLVRWLAEETGIRVIDDGNLGTQNRVQFFGDIEIDREQLFDLVQGILRSNELALVRSDLDTPGFYRVVKLARIRPFAPQGDPAQFPSSEYLTAVFPLKHVASQQAANYLKQLIYGADNQTGNNITVLDRPNALVITDTSRRLKKIAELVAQIDVDPKNIVTRFYTVEFLQAPELEQQLKAILNLQTSTEAGSSPAATAGQPALRIVSDLRTNRLVLIGTSDQIARAEALIQQLDIDLGLKLATYQFEHVPAQKIDELVRQSLAGLDEESVERIYRSNVEQASNRLTVTTREEIHQRIRQLQEKLDEPQGELPDAASPIRFYSLKNVKAADILDTLQTLVGRLQQRQQRRQRLTGIVTRSGLDVVGPNNPPEAVEGELVPPPFSLQNPESQSPSLVAPEPGRIRNDTTTEAAASNTIIPGAAKVTVDENSNTLIVVAEPPVQRLYAELIEKLDKRRPQVMIEVFVVTISGSEDLNLGIEVSGGDRSGGQKQTFAFSSFELSEVNPSNGALSIIPGIGFNGVVIDPDIADVVIRALAQNSRSRVVGAPKILVNDNSTGVLSSVAEVPFASINASNTVATTSFAGFAQAGTTISMTPQISQDDYINLEFDILVNDFTAAAENNLPPPRTTDQVTSQAAIPDGHTVIVGGLKRRGVSQTIQSVPLLNRIPVLRRLASNESNNQTEQRLYVFIKPTILRNDEFKDLRFLSEVDVREACIPGDWPKSEPVIVR